MHEHRGSQGPETTPLSPLSVSTPLVSLALWGEDAHEDLEAL